MEFEQRWCALDRLVLHPALSGDAERTLHVFARGGNAPLCALESILLVQESQVELGLRPQVQVLKWFEERVVVTRDRNGHVDELDGARRALGDRVTHASQERGVFGLLEMASLGALFRGGIAVTEVETHLDLGRYE